MVKRVRNWGRLPYVSTEGAITKPFAEIKPPSIRGEQWYNDLTPFERVHAHQTLASVRRYAHFRPFSGLIPKDNLDFLLASSYNHTLDTFPDKQDSCLQFETLDVDTWRRLRNTEDVQPARDAKGPNIMVLQGGTPIERYNNSHPVIIGGIKQKEHPSHVKLMNSSHHSPQTNAGYCRQDRDGTFFQY